MNFSSEILSWYRKNKRDLPWRRTIDPYKIWISEIMLQQTKVAQALPYYNRFIKEFPTILDLSLASEDKVLKLWEGLGYYSRARNLHYTSKKIVKEFNGCFPIEYHQILNLKGVGEYTASAISSFAFSNAYAVVDGNVIRVLSRFFGIETPYDTSGGKKFFKNLAQELLIKENPAEYNQAIMEFGALQCTPKSPACKNCMLQQSCIGHSQDRVSYYPQRKNKVKLINRYLHFFIINQEQKICIQKRKEGIWKGLYEFPFLEFNKSINEKKVMNSLAWDRFFEGNTEIVVEKVSLEMIHKLSHQILFVKFWHIISEELKLNDYQWIHYDEIYKYPVSRLLQKYITTSFAAPSKN